MKNTLKEIIGKVDRVVTISNTAKEILVRDYEISPEKVEGIYHGAHEQTESTEESKKILGLENRFVLSTPGLIRKNRGIEYAIQSLPEVVEKHPDLLYIVAGATHPSEIEGGREPYRELLEKTVSKNGLEENVSFVNRSLSLESLLRYIQASDVCITPYTFSGQVSSGVLSYCVGLDKPVISTPFLYAKELLGGGRGILLPDFNNPPSMSKAIMEVVENPDKINEIKRNIAPIKEDLMWPNVAQTYYKIEKELIGN